MKVRFVKQVCAIGGGFWEIDSVREVDTEMATHLLQIGAAERVQESTPRPVVPEAEAAVEATEKPTAAAKPRKGSSSKRSRKS